MHQKNRFCSSSVVVVKQVYTIVDSGSTVNIEDLTANTVVEDFDASAYAKITAYNGTTSKSDFHPSAQSTRCARGR